MTDLKGLQDRLNSDPECLQEFLDDPVQVLSNEGMVLPPEAEAELRALAQQAKAKVTTGSSVGTASAGGISINISIPI